MTVFGDEVVYLYEDTTAQLSIEEVSHPAWAPLYSPLSAVIQYEKKSILWMRFSIENGLDTLQKLILYLNDWDVSIWAKTGNQTSYLMQKGIMAPYTKPESYPGEDTFSSIPVEIPPRQTITYYVKTRGYLNRSALFVAVQQSSHSNKSIPFSLISLGIYTGSFLIAILASFFMFVRSPKWRYVFYALHCISYFVFFGGYYRIDFFIPLEFRVTHTIFLPLAIVFHLLFVYSFLALARKNKLLGWIFKGYILLLSGVIFFLFYFLYSHSPYYYFILLKVNKINFCFALFSLIALARIRGRSKYFILVALFFLFCGYFAYGYAMSLGVAYVSFIYPMAGSMFEMVAFLLGNFYLISKERKKAMQHLSEKENELEKKKALLCRFTLDIKEKNKLIEEFRKRQDKVHDCIDDQKVEYIRQMTQSTILTDKDWMKFKSIFEEVYKNFFFKLKSKQLCLTEGEVRLAALTKLDLSTKEMAHMLGISPNSINKSRYRLRKKLSEKGIHSLEDLVSMD